MMTAEKTLPVPQVPPAWPLFPGTETGDLESRKDPFPHVKGKVSSVPREERTVVSGRVAVASFVLGDGFRETLLLRVCWLSLSLCSLIAGAACRLCLGDFPVVTSPCPWVVPHLRWGAAQGPLREQGLPGPVKVRNVQACGAFL